MNEKIDVLAVMDRLERAGKTNAVAYLGTEAGVVAMEQLVDIRQARAAIAELIEATPSLLALYRIKWGNLDPDANAVLATFERAFSRVGGAK